MKQSEVHSSRTMFSQLPVKPVFCWRCLGVCSQKCRISRLHETHSAKEKDIKTFSRNNCMLVCSCETLTGTCSLEVWPLCQSGAQRWVCCVVMRAGCGLRMRRRKIRTLCLRHKGQRTDSGRPTQPHRKRRTLHSPDRHRAHCVLKNSSGTVPE